MAAKRRKAKASVIHKPKKREMFDDPEPPDENDPVFREEMFDLYQGMGMKPEELEDEEERKQYQEWLKKSTGRDPERPHGGVQSLDSGRSGQHVHDSNRQQE